MHPDKVLVPFLLCHSDELLQPEDEAHISGAQQQQKRAGPLQASQGERMVLAPSGFPSGRLASLQLPCYSQFWHLHPPPASAVEPCALCRILDVSKRCHLCSGWLSLWLFRFVHEGNSCLFCSWTRQGFCCVCVCVCAACMGSSHAQTVSVSVVSINTKRHNQWWFCHMVNAV